MAGAIKVNHVLLLALSEPYRVSVAGRPRQRGDRRGRTMSALGVKRTSHRALPGRQYDQNDINLGIGNIIVGLAPPKPR